MRALPGVSGLLISPSFLARIAESLAGPAQAEDFRQRIDTVRVQARARLGPASSVRAVFETAVAPLVTTLGFDRIGGVASHGRLFGATAHLGSGASALVAAPWAEPLDGCSRDAVVFARAHASDWCLLSNGVRLRVVDAHRLYSRRFVEIDLALAGDRADVALALWRAAGAAGLVADPADPGSLHALVRESERDSHAVCRSLRDGVRSASAEILSALLGARRGAGADPDEAFQQSLTIVYRIVFLLFAEARSLVPVWHPVYRESYSVESLREIAEASGSPRGLWDALRAIGRLAHAGCRAGDLRVAPFNGRLFAPQRTPLAERRGLDNGAARRAVLALSTRPSADRAGRERIAYGDLGVEQLGAVYETLLDYQPRVARRGAVLEPGSLARKATGSFYTPQPIADFLVKRTLAPLVQGRTADEILRLRIVDPAMGSGACLVSACRFLSGAYEHALVESGSCHPGDIDEAARSGIRRRVAECLYGVDLNPMAVQLARLSLWLTTLAGDRPLSFLDHRLMTGDSVTGAWLSSLRRPPIRRPSRAADLPLLGDEAAVGALHAALPVRFTLESVPDDTIDQVRAKERALVALGARDGGLARWKRIADLWCAAWFGGPRSIPPQAFAALAESIATGTHTLPPATTAGFLDCAEAIAARRRFFHWELEFPEAFFDADGRRLPRPGFDAVIGNPPWDMVRADAGDAGLRRAAREEVEATIRFARHSGVYESQSTGHANRYQLFLERAMALTRSGGRIGLVLPWGLAADRGSAALRHRLFSSCAVNLVVGFDNHRAIFPIHRSVRFLVLTATAGSPTTSIACHLGIDSTAALEPIADAESPSVHVTVGAIERLSGASLELPYLKTPADMAIAERAAALFPALRDADGWNAVFGRELNATDDRDAFDTGGRGVPIVDGRHLEPFRVNVTAAARSIARLEAVRRIGPGRIDRARLAYRDIASATNRLTLIAAILPRAVVSTHTVFCLRTQRPLRDQHALCALFNSFVLNYLVRLRVTTHVTTAIVEHLPVPPRAAAPAAMRTLAVLGRRLARRADAAAFAELNAIVARLYQLTREEFEHVLGTFPLIPEDQRTAALERFVAGGTPHR